MPISPLSKGGAGDEMSQGVWSSQTSLVEWGVKGEERLGVERNGLSRYGPPVVPVSSLPKELINPRETMRVFPNGRDKLGGKEIKINF